MPKLALVTPDESQAIVAAFEHLVAQGRQAMELLLERISREQP